MHGDRIIEEVLSAFIDGELEAGEAERLTRAIAADPALAERVACLRADKERLAVVYAPLLDRPLPQAWAERLAAGTRPPARPGWRLAVAAMAAVMALVLAGWLVQQHFLARPADFLVAEALAARDGVRAPERRIDAAALDSAAAGDAVVAGSLAIPVKIPDLRRMGYALASIALYPGQPRRPVQLSYRNDGGRLFTVFLTGPTGPDGFELLSRGAMKVCIWRNGELSAVMTGEMTTSEMLRIASLTYSDLEL